MFKRDAEILLDEQHNGGVFCVHVYQGNLTFLNVIFTVKLLNPRDTPYSTMSYRTCDDYSRSWKLNTRLCIIYRVKITWIFFFKI